MRLDSETPAALATDARSACSRSGNLHPHRNRTRIQASRCAGEPRCSDLAARTIVLGAVLASACLWATELCAGHITQIMEGGLVWPYRMAVDASENVYVVSMGTDKVFKITSGGVITEIIDGTGDGGGNTLTNPNSIAVDGSGNVYVTGSISDNAFKITPGGVITEIIDTTGDGGNALNGPQGISVDALENVYVAGRSSDNAFKITSGGIITEIIDPTGDGGGNSLNKPDDIAVDGSGNVYVTGQYSHNAFKITPGGVITEIIDITGDGGGNQLFVPHDIAVDGSGNVYLTGENSHNAFKITPGGVITEIIDATGDGGGNTLSSPYGIAVDASENAYVTGAYSDNAFKITPGGVITEIIDATGDGGGNTLDDPRGITVDGSGNAYVTGSYSDNAFKITPGGVITEIIDATGDGSGINLGGPAGIAVDGSGNLYVVGRDSDNAFKITPGGVITEIIDITGDGGGNQLLDPHDIAVDGSGNVYLTGESSHNAFKITPGGVITEIIDATGDGGGNTLARPFGIAVDGFGNVYVLGGYSHNVFKISPGGGITEIIDATGDGGGNTLENPRRVAADDPGNVYVAGHTSDNAFKITPGGVITEIIDDTGDGGGNPLDNPFGIAVDGSGNVYVTGLNSDNAFKITPGGVITEIIDATGDGGENTLTSTSGIAVDGLGNVYVTGEYSNNAFEITPGGVITEIIDVTGDGGGNTLFSPFDIAVDAPGNVYVAGLDSHNVFKIALAPPLFVDADAAGASDGSSWDDAYTALQDALTEASGTPRDIWVAAGTYTPDVGVGHTPGLRTETFQLLNGVAIHGGFAGGETSLEQRNITVNETILSGDLLDDDTLVGCTQDSPDCDTNGERCIDGYCIIASGNSENTLRVVTGNGIDSSAVLDGFTITGGNADGSYPDNFGAGMSNRFGGSPTVANCTFSGNYAGHGAGMHNDTGCSPTVVNCEFVENAAGSFGGGMKYEGLSSSTVTNCTFSDNSGGSVGGGGGMCTAASSSPTLTNCTFSGNSGRSGGGMYNTGSPTVTNSTFSGNTAGWLGGGMSNSGTSNPMVTNCTFSGNSAIDYGGGMHNGDSSNPTLTNCTFFRNSAGRDGGGMDNSHSSTPAVSNSIFWGNIDDAQGDGGGPYMDESAQIYTSSGTPTVNYSIVQGGWTGAGGTGNSASDPLFIDADGLDNIPGTEDDDVRLRVGSAAIDAGDNDALPADTADLDDDLDTSEEIPIDLAGNDRRIEDPNVVDTGNAGTVGTPVVDMGAFEFDPPIFVDDDAGGANDGSSWTDAYTSLQDALGDAGSAPRNIWVAEGTYTPDVKSCTVDGDCDGPGGGTCPAGECVWNSPRGQTFQLINGVAIYGGFAGTESSLDQREIIANETILSGDLSGDDAPVSCAQDSPDCDDNGELCAEDGFCIIFNDNGENSYHVTTGSGTGATALLDGFTIIAGNADGTFPDSAGAGMYNDSSSSPTVSNCTFNGNSATIGGGMLISGSPTVTNCTFIGNSTDQGGGGMFNTGSPTVANCTFKGNSASGGAGMFNSTGGDPTVADCTFIGNLANTGGGMANVDNSSPTVTNCTFSGNRGYVGGGIFNSGSPAVTNCTFIGNMADRGGGLYNQENSEPTLTNCTLSGNSANNVGGGMYNNVGGGDSPVVTNCILWGNVDDADGNSGGPFMDESAQIHTSSGTPVVNYSVVMGGWTGAGGTGNSTFDPLFVNPLGADGVAGTLDDDLRLLPESPAIDAGDNTAVPTDDADIDGDLDTTERVPLDLDANLRFYDDTATGDTGIADPPDYPAVVDMGAYEFFTDCNANGLPDECDLDCEGLGGACISTPGCGLSADCNTNGVPDECDTTTCDIVGVCQSLVCVGGFNNGNACADDSDCIDVACNDCNLNGVPDVCDDPIDSIPDECVEYIGPASGSWSDPANWNLGGDYPDNDAEVYSVTLKGSDDNVIMDIPVTIDSLRVLNGANLAVTGGDLTIVTDGGIVIDGATALGGSASTTVAVSDTRSVNATNITLRGNENGTGEVTVDGSAMINVTGAFNVIGGGEYLAAGAGSTAVLSAGSVLLDGGSAPDVPGGTMALSGSMLVQTTGDFVMDGTGAPPCEAGGLRVPPRTRPILPTIDQATVAVGSNLVLLGSPEIMLAPESSITIAGTFDNQSISPDCLDFSDGQIVVNGGSGGRRAVQEYEVGGSDWGPDTDGFAPPGTSHSNLSVGTLTITAGSVVRFIDHVDNDGINQSPGTEALYVHTLILESGAGVTVADCKVFYETLDDNGVLVGIEGAGVFAQVIAASIVPPLLAPPPHDILKNRYISIDPRGAGEANVGFNFDIRVTLSSTLVNGVTAVGSSWWANAPDAACISVVGPMRPALAPNWDACPTLHLTGCPIIPTSTYEIAVADGALESDPPLVAQTQALPGGNKWWGDTVGQFDPVADNWGPPNGSVAIDDAVAAIKTFQNPSLVGPGCGTPPCNATHVSVTDLQPHGFPGTPFGTPNQQVDINDVFGIILGFQGVEYPGPQIELCMDP